MQKPAFRKAFDEGYQELLLSELVLAVMAEDKKSVRELGLSKAVIQNLRSGMQADMKLSNFLKFTQAYGYRLVLEKGDRRISL